MSIVSVATQSREGADAAPEIVVRTTDEIHLLTCDPPSQELFDLIRYYLRSATGAELRP